MVQTFSPYADFERSARALDLKRLGKQRVEVVQIVRALTVPGYAWSTHPAALMWRGYEEALGRYGLTICAVWREHGFDDTCAASITADLAAVGIDPIRSYAELAAAGLLPDWLSDPALQDSHRSALVRKDPERYGPMFPDATPDLPYFWPVRAPAVVEREERRAAHQRLRAERTAERTAERQRIEQEARRRRRSEAARRGWRTRAARQDPPRPD